MLILYVIYKLNIFNNLKKCNLGNKNIVYTISYFLKKLNIVLQFTQITEECERLRMCSSQLLSVRMHISKHFNISLVCVSKLTSSAIMVQQYLHYSL